MQTVIRGTLSRFCLKAASCVRRLRCALPDLLICVEGSASDEDAGRCRAQFEHLSASAWTYQPTFVDQLDALPVSSSGDLPAIRTAGVVVSLPAPGAESDERTVRNDVSRLVALMSRFAAAHNLELVVEYAGEEIGWLDGSDNDQLVVSRFFGES